MADAANKRWHIAVLLGLGVLINYFDRVNLSVAHGALQSAFGMSDVLFGYMLSAYSWTYAALQLPGGALLDRWGVRRVMLGATALWTVASALAAVAPTVAFLFGARLLLGVGEAPSFPANAKAIGLWFAPRERSAPTAVFDAAAKLSVGLGTPVLGLVLLRYGMRFSFAATAVLSLLYTLLFALVYRDPRPDEAPSDDSLADFSPGVPSQRNHPSLDFSEDLQRGSAAPQNQASAQVSPTETAPDSAPIRAAQASPAAQAAFRPPRRPPAADTPALSVSPDNTNHLRLAELLRNRKIVGAALGSGAYNYCFYLLLTWLPVYLERGVHLDAHRAVLLSGIPWIVAAAADFFIGGLLVDALLRRGRDADRVRRTVLLGGTALGLFIFAPALTHASGAVVICLSLGLGGLAAAAPIVWTLPSLLAPPGGSGRVGSLLNFIAQIAAISAPIATGYISRETHSFTLAFVVAGTLLLLGLASYSVLLGRIEPVH